MSEEAQAAIPVEELTPADAGALADVLMRTLVVDTPQEAMAARERVIALARRSGDSAILADALLWHHRVLLFVRRNVEAHAAREESRVLATMLRDDAALASCEVCDAQADQFDCRNMDAIVKLERAWPRLASHRDPTRVRAAAAFVLAYACASLQLHDEAIAAAEEAANLYESRGDTSAAWRVRYVGLANRLDRAVLRGGPLAKASADDPDVVEVENIVRGLLATSPERHFDGNYRYLLFSVLAESRRETEAVAFWLATSHIPMRNETPDVRASVAINVDGPARAIEILTTALKSDSERDSERPGTAADRLIRWRLLAEAYGMLGDHQQVAHALKHMLHLSQSVAHQTAQARAALLSLELDSEREKLQAQRALVHAGKLAAVGKLASSIAHEVSQPSAALMLLGADAHEALRAGRMELLDEVLGDMDRQVVRLGRLVNRMKEFSRDDPLHMERLELRGVVEEAAQLCKPMVAATKVAFTVNVPDLEVHADKERVILSLVNLVNNALDAMREQHDPAPSLRIEAAQREGTPPWIVLSVIDNGPGLSKEALAHMSEPFFTTKSTGLGLGLTITREALSGMHAQLEIANDGERGARLSVLLRPAADPRST